MSLAVSSAALAHGLRGDIHEFQVWRGRSDLIAGPAYPDALRKSSFAAFVDARVAVHTGTVVEAHAIGEHGFANFGTGRHTSYARAAAAELSVVAGLPDAADRVALAVESIADNQWAAACLARMTGQLHGDTPVLADALVNLVAHFGQSGADVAVQTDDAAPPGPPGQCAGYLRKLVRSPAEGTTTGV